MKPLERPTDRVAFRAGIIVFAALLVLALSSTSARRVEPAMHASAAVGGAAATPAAAENNDTAQTSTGTAALSAKEVRGATPYIEIKNEPPPKLIVDEVLPDGLPEGIVWIQYRTENFRILPVFGKEALKVSPRVGHLHVRVDDLPWLWAHTSNINTIDIGGMPPGEHKVTIELVDPMHQVHPGQSKTVTFTVPKGASKPHGH
jgi:hypothetical protein